MWRWILNIIIWSLVLLMVLLGVFLLFALVHGVAMAAFSPNLSLPASLVIAVVILLSIWYFYHSPPSEQILLQNLLAVLVAAIVYGVAISQLHNVFKTPQDWLDVLGAVFVGFIVAIPGFAAGYVVAGSSDENNKGKGGNDYVRIKQQLEKLEEQHLIIGLWLIRQCQGEDVGNLRTSLTKAVGDAIFIRRIIDGLYACTDDELATINPILVGRDTAEDRMRFYVFCKTLAERLLERGINVLEGVERLRRDLADSKEPI